MDDERNERLSDDPAGEFSHVGAMLAAMREKAGLTLEEAAQKTHIKKEHLAAIETLDRHGMPAKPYAVGFVKAYAALLELDPNPVVLRFKVEAELSAQEKPKPREPEANETARDIEAGNMSIWAVAAIIGFIIWCAWQVTRPQEVTWHNGAGATLPIAAHRITEDGSVDADRAFKVESGSAVIVAPRVIEKVDPIYPRNCASDAGSLETIVVSYDVTEVGRVSSERVVQSSNGCFDDAVLNALRRWRFEPKTVDGVARPAFDQKYSFSFPKP